MQEHETIHERAKTWRNNVKRFIDSQNIEDHKDIGAFEDGFNAIIDGVVRDSCSNWVLDDETCPFCGSKDVYRIGTTVKGTHHKDGEINTVWRGSGTTTLEIDCYDCKEVLLTSPAAVFCPAISGEFPTEKDGIQQTIRNGVVKGYEDEINVTRDLMSELTAVTDWEPGEEVTDNQTKIIIESRIDGYQSVISNGVFHCDSLSDWLATIEYKVDGENNVLQQSPAALLVSLFSL